MFPVFISIPLILLHLVLILTLAVLRRKCRTPRRYTWRRFGLFTDTYRRKVDVM